VAVKRTRGVEICTRWRRFEHAVVIPFKDLVAVTIQEVIPEAEGATPRRLPGGWGLRLLLL
jgi:hypothetical protein